MRAGGTQEMFSDTVTFVCSNIDISQTNVIVQLYHYFLIVENITRIILCSNSRHDMFFCHLLVDMLSILLIRT